MTNNDILAEYVRKNYPKIEKSIDFALFKVTKRIASLGDVFKKIGGNYEETNSDNTDYDNDDRSDADNGECSSDSEVHNEDGGSEREAGCKERNDSASDTKQETRCQGAE